MTSHKSITPALPDVQDGERVGNAAAAHAQRSAAIARASMFRNGEGTIDATGQERWHDSISAAKRYSRSQGLGKCVAQRKGEDLFAVMRASIVKAEAEAKAKAEAKAQAAKDAAAVQESATTPVSTTEAEAK